MNMEKNVKNKFFLILYILFMTVFQTAIISCGGGGGGGGMVAFNGSSSTLHNGGWGTGSQTGGGLGGASIEETAGLLISQMAALDVSTVTINLTINGTPYPAINADATTTTAVLPRINPGDIVSGTAAIHLTDGTTRTANLDETEAQINGTLKFKVPYSYTAKDLSGAQVAAGTYFARDGIHLETVTVDPIAGWQCVQDGTTHYGGYVTGVRGDITLNAVQGGGTPVLTASASPNVLYARTASSDTATITITGVTGTNPPIIGPDMILNYNTLTQTGPDSYTVDIKIAKNQSGAPVWFNDDSTASVTITDDSGATTSVPLTLKNIYSYTLQKPDGTPVGIPTQIQAGGTLAFNTAKSNIGIGQVIAAFKQTDSTPVRIYKESDFPITFNSTNLTSRNITLQAIPEFTYSVKNAVDAEWTGTSYGSGADTGPLFSLQKDSSTTKEMKVILSDLSANPDISLQRTNEADNYLDISTINNGEFTVRLKDTVTLASIDPNGVIHKLTIKDNDTGVTKVIWIKIEQPIIPPCTISLQTTAPTKTYMSSSNIYQGYPANSGDHHNYTFKIVRTDDASLAFPAGTTFEWVIKDGTGNNSGVVGGTQTYTTTTQTINLTTADFGSGNDAVTYGAQGLIIRGVWCTISVPGADALVKNKEVRFVKGY